MERVGIATTTTPLSRWSTSTVGQGSKDAHGQRAHGQASARGRTRGVVEVRFGRAKDGGGHAEESEEAGAMQRGAEAVKASAWRARTRGEAKEDGRG